MKRPLGYACLFFILFIRLFYVCFPPNLPDYGELKGREVYIRGRVISIQTQEYNDKLQTIWVLDEVCLQEDTAAHNSYLSDKNISVSDTKDNSGTTYVHKEIRCYSSNVYSQIYIGSTVWVKGKFVPYEAAKNPGQFDSRFYYYVHGVGASLQNTELVWSDSAKNVPMHFLYRIKNHFLDKISLLFLPEYGGVMKTILLGDKTDLDKEVKQLYQEGGILHILTISGLHISMLGMGCVKLLRKIGGSVKASAVVGLLVVVFYGAMIGTQAATFRAICMFIIQMAAILSGRTYDRLTGLSVAAILLLLEQPMYVFYSGFLLSFGAVLGVTVISPVVEELFKDRGQWAERLAKWFAGGISILLATLPIQLAFYYEYSLYSMLINLVVLPFLPFVVGMGTLVLAIPFGIRVTALPAVWGCQGILYVYEWICEQSKKLPGHCFVLGAPDTWQIIGYYLLLVMVLLWIWYGKFPRKLLVMPVYLFVAGFLLFSRSVDGLCCRFLSVGQGDCAVIQYQKETYVVDCGSTSESNVGLQVLLPCLKYYGVREVAGVFISHKDADHINGIVQWLEQYEHAHVKIKRIILPTLEEKALEQEFGELIGLAEANGIVISTLGAGDSLQLKKLSVLALHPQKGCRDTEDANGYSQVLFWAYQGQGILMTGDIGTKEEQVILKSLDTGQNGEIGAAQVEVLKAAHHGSKYSCSEEFLRFCEPAHVVLSYGVGNSYGHPHKETLERLENVGSRVLSTTEYGAITIVIEDNIKISGFLETKE